jgi:cytochrome c oxidase subunit 2
MPVKDDPSKPFVIQANGLQYAWIFTYPNSGVVAGELHVQLGVRFSLRFPLVMCCMPFGCQSFG